MPNFYKILVLLATLVFLVFLIAPDFPRKIFSFSKLLINEYVPTHTEKSMQKRLTKEASKIKKDALDAFLPHINIESLNLTLKKLPKRKIVRIGMQNFQVLEYRANFLTLVKRKPEIGPSYISLQEEELFIAQENGLFFSLPLNKILIEKAENIRVKTYESNITDFVDYFDFYVAGQFGIKDILIDEKVMYVSYIREFENNCFNVSILQAEIKKYLDFSILYSPQECINRNMNNFNAHQTGGRLSKYKKNMILFDIKLNKFGIGEDGKLQDTTL